MVSATAGAVTTSYAHNGLGERVAKDDGSAATYFVYDEAGHLIGEYDETGALIQETVWFGDMPIATLRPDGQSGVDVYYVHVDHLNTPRKVTRPGDDEIVWRWDSDPFGETLADEDPDGDQATFEYGLRFPGQYFDGETGLHYNYFRDYDAVTGRYAQSDPIGLGGGVNTYAYAQGDPLTFFDPFGLDVYRGAGNYYSDIAPSGQCERAVFSGGYIIAWGACEPAVVQASRVADSSDSCKVPGKSGAGRSPEASILWDVVPWLIPELKGVQFLGAFAARGTTTVYRSLNAAGDIQYVGITNNLARRAAEHLRGSGIRIERILGGLSRTDARAVEQALIEIHGLGRHGGTLLNRINSIAQSNPAYADRLRRGYELLQTVGY